MSDHRIGLNLVTLKGRPGPGTLVQKLRAAADAGFHAVGMRVEDVAAWLRAGRTLQELHRTIADLGLAVSELGEVVLCNERGRAADRTREFAMAAALGAPCISVVYNNSSATLEEAREHWGGFIEMVSDVENVRAALHFQGDAPNLNTLDAAWNIVDDGPSKGALALDAYEFWRGKSPVASLNAVPIELIAVVHLSDVKNLQYDASGSVGRILPGEGVMPLTHIVSTLTRRGYSGVFSIEVVGECGSRDRRRVAGEAFRGVRKLLSTSGPCHRKQPGNGTPGTVGHV